MLGHTEYIVIMVECPLQHFLKKYLFFTKNISFDNQNHIALWVLDYEQKSGQKYDTFAQRTHRHVRRVLFKHDLQQAWLMQFYLWYMTTNDAMTCNVNDIVHNKNSE